MPRKTSSSKKKALNDLDPLAMGLKKTVEQLWGIFVRRYVARGVAELFVAIVIAWLTLDKLWTDHWIYWLAIPFPIILLLCLDAIQLLINPHYFAMDDIADRVKEEKNSGKAVELYQTETRYR